MKGRSKNGAIFHLITEEDFDPVEARINWLIDHLYDIWLCNEDEFCENALINLYAVRECWEWYRFPRFTKDFKS